MFRFIFIFRFFLIFGHGRLVVGVTSQVLLLSLQFITESLGMAAAAAVFFARPKPRSFHPKAQLHSWLV